MAARGTERLAWKSMMLEYAGEPGARRRPVGKRWPNQISDETVERVLHPRRH